ncbi:hypothetical protein [Corallococcus sp. EGB]|uniref:hypothetical protein n=1 Tax=Corallococcus sp. EGB TaxID=1521117 RepID=UPI002714717B|nr:hypothetical protein [Corallococcus sp. EGB]
MNLQRSILSWVVLSLAVFPMLPGCGSDDVDTPPDAGSRTDAGTTPDAGTEPDAGSTPDAGTETDAGSSPDAGTENDAGSTPDAGTETDAGTTTDAGTEADAGTTTDAGTETDAGTGTDAGTQPDPFTTCEGACKDTTITLQMDGNQATMTNAFFGYEEPSNPGEPWTLWFEFNNGAPGECPSEDSEVPPQLANVYSVKLPEDATPQEGSPSNDGPAAVVIDFDGTLTEDFFVRSTSLTFTPVAASLCPSCIKAGTPPASHFVAFDVKGAFANGTMTGHAYATYCPSLDTFQDN